MGRDDWYRRSTWSAQDQQEFWARLRKSRTPDRQAQYLSIQASHLEQAGLLGAAVALLDGLLRDYPSSLFYAQVHCQLASCREKEGDDAGALAALKKALAFEADHPNVLTRAFFELGRLIVEHDLVEEHATFLSYREGRASKRRGGGQEALVPLDRYLLGGTLAAIQAHRGEISRAREFAKVALQAADDNTSPFRYHRDVGRVRNLNTRFYRRVVSLAADG